MRSISPSLYIFSSYAHLIRLLDCNHIAAYCNHRGCLCANLNYRIYSQRIISKISVINAQIIFYYGLMFTCDVLLYVCLGSINNCIIYIESICLANPCRTKAKCKVLVYSCWSDRDLFKQIASCWLATSGAWMGRNIAMYAPSRQSLEQCALAVISIALVLAVYCVLCLQDLRTCRLNDILFIIN